MDYQPSHRFRGVALGAVLLLTLATTAKAAIDGSKHFAEPSAVPTYGPNNYIPTFGDGPGNVFGVESPGPPNVLGATDLWTLGDAHTTRQEWSDLYARRLNSRSAQVDAIGGLQTDGSGPVFSGTITASAPGYITTSGNFYSYAGDFTGTILAGNYGGVTGSRAGGTLALFQTSSAANPDVRPMFAIGNPDGTYDEGYDPLGIEITLHDGSPVPGGASILHWGINFQAIREPSPHGEIPWQENLWSIWMPEWTGDFRVHYGNVNHGAFSAARLDTAIGSMNSDPSLANFVVGPPAEPGLVGDFNADDVVDGADFLAWQRGLGTTHNSGQLEDWQANFGATLSASASGVAAVPEPAAISLAIVASLLGMCLSRRTTKWS